MMYFLKKNKIKLILIAIIIVITTSIAILSSPNKTFSNKYVPKIAENTPYEVIDSIDGDTFDIKINKETVRIRMLGVDTPETLDPRKPVQCYGKEASNKTKELLKGHSVTLAIDKKQSYSDKYGRILAYVYVDDGLFLNKFLLENGYAHEYTYDKAYSKQKEFKKLEKEAKKLKIGLWGNCPI